MESPPTFTERVQIAASQIPKGKVITYGNLAKKAGNPAAARAVGTIMAHNFLDCIPCHRVIPANGRVGKYNRSGGETEKTQKLQAEGVNTQNLKAHYWE
jgi:methylated-DNA-[protein]-cysteine S-methyltransferase